jgi:hypothetical protein
MDWPASAKQNMGWRKIIKWGTQEGGNGGGFLIWNSGTEKGFGKDRGKLSA